MSTLRNYAAAPQIPNQAGYGPFPINNQAGNVAVLPNIFPCNWTGERMIENMSVTTPQNPVALVLAVPSKSIIEAKRFEVTASGRMQKINGISGSIQVRIYLGGSMTISQNILMTGPALTGNTIGVQPFDFRLQFIADGVAGLIAGSASSLVQSTFSFELVVPSLAAFPISFRNDPVVRFSLSASPFSANIANFVVVNEFAVNF
jgi:hypothetical protein